MKTNDVKTKVQDDPVVESENLKKIQELVATIDSVEDEKLEISNKLMKALADYQNLERSLDQRVLSKLDHMKRDVALSLIEVVDDIRFGVVAAEELKMDEQMKAWLDGVLGTLSKMDRVLEKLEVSKIDVNIGEAFDSSRHEAIGMIDGGEPNAVANIIQNGYLMGANVIRPARVMVYK